MSSSTTCTECGDAIPSGSPGGFCAQCLLGLGLDQVQSTESGSVQSLKSKVQSHEPAAAVPLKEKIGDRIGRYRLLEEIGHGGCGVVYMAEQEQPVRRKVALKVIKLGMDTQQVVGRFEAERQALALMDHTNIAKVLDAGATDSGRPYFVMELVGGIKITEYCDRNQLDVRERLNLFIQVCRAIQHAHQKGIIHRDIKPSNVLVAVQEAVPVPKVIDFGIAKATQGKLTDQTLFTAFEQFLGTPAYMSPEQTELGALDVDTRSDIYSLGVLLYELLTGDTPFDSKKLLSSGLDAMRRTIQEEDPPTPSTRLKKSAAGSDTSTLRTPHSALDKDLDWIVMKCLEKERARRYETANGLATDIERHLKSEPVVAGPPDNFYRFQKLVRRNLVVATSGGIVAVVLILGVIASSWQAIRATRAEREQSRLRQRAQSAQANEAREREKAQREVVRSQQVAAFLTDMLQGVGPSAARGRDTTMLREILDKTSQRVTNDLHEQPDVEAELMSIIGGVYAELGEDQEAEQIYRQSLTLRTNLFGCEDPLVAESLAHLCYTLWRQNKRVEAEARGREAVNMYRKLQGKSPGIENSKLAYALDQLANTLLRSNRRVQAEALAREALALISPENTERRVYALWVLAVVISDRPVEAESLLREAVAIRPTTDGLSNLAQAIAAQGRFEEAESVLREGIDLARQSNDLDTLVHSLRTLGGLLWHQGKLDEAEIAFRESIEIVQKTFGSKHRVYQGLLTDLGETLQQHGKPGEAAIVLHEALAAGLKEDRLEERLVTIQRLVQVLMEDNNPAGVDQLFYELNSASANEAALVLRARGNYLARHGQWEPAEADFSRAFELHPFSLHLQLLAAVRLQRGNLEAYRGICQVGIDRARKDTNSKASLQDVDSLALQRIAISSLVLPTGGRDLQELSKMADEAMTHSKALKSPPFLITKSLAEYRQGHFAEAVQWSKRALACLTATNEWIRVQIHAVHAMVQCQLQETNAAQASLAKAIELADSKSSKLPSGDPGSQWLERVYADALMREAKGAVEGEPK